MAIGLGFLNPISGTPDSTTFLRGDRTWAVPTGGGIGGSYGYWPPVVAAVGATAYEKSLVSISGGLQCVGSADEAAFNALLANEGDTVQATSGTYNFSSPLLFTKSGQQLLTAGWKTTFTSNLPIDLISSTINGSYSSDGCYIGPLTLDGNNETALRGIFGQWMMRWVIDRPNIHHFKNWGIQLASIDGHSCHIRQPWLWSNGVTGTLDYSGGLKIGSEHDELNLSYPVVNVEGGYLEWNRDAIWILGTTQSHIHTVIEGNKRHGIVAYCHAGYILARLKIYDCYFELNNAGSLGGYDVYIKSQNEASYPETITIDNCRQSPDGPAKFLYVEPTGSDKVYLNVCNMGAISPNMTIASANVNYSNSS